MVKFNSTSQFSNENNFFMGARYTYVPTSMNADGSAWGIRKKVWKFKDGDIETTAETALWVARTLEENITLLDTCTFVCIPASDAERHEMRYCQFAKDVCKATGMANAYSHIKVEGSRLAIHENKICKSISEVQTIKFDKKYFNGRKVVIFDDVVTKGASLNTFVDYLEELGAEVIGAIFLAKTAAAE